MADKATIRVLPCPWNTSMGPPPSDRPAAGPRLPRSPADITSLLAFTSPRTPHRSQPRSPADITLLCLASLHTRQELLIFNSRHSGRTQWGWAVPPRNGLSRLKGRTPAGLSVFENLPGDFLGSPAVKNAPLMQGTLVLENSICRRGNCFCAPQLLGSPHTLQLFWPQQERP